MSSSHNPDIASCLDRYSLPMPSASLPVSEPGWANMLAMLFHLSYLTWYSYAPSTGETSVSYLSSHRTVSHPLPGHAPLYRSLLVLLLVVVLLLLVVVLLALLLLLPSCPARGLASQRGRFMPAPTSSRLLTRFASS